jgi:hypothetical protein
MTGLKERVVSLALLAEKVNELVVEKVAVARVAEEQYLTTTTEEDIMSVQVGQQAPDFSLKTNKMKDFKLSDYQGKQNVVLLFVPLAFTGG